MKETTIFLAGFIIIGILFLAMVCFNLWYDPMEEWLNEGL